MADVAQRAVICFRVCGQKFGFPIRQVREVVTFQPLTRLFHTPASIAGLMNLRGQVLLVLNLAALLGLSGEEEEREATRVCVLSDEQREAGVLCERVLGKWEYAASAARPVLGELDPNLRAYLSEIVPDGNDSVLILDVEKVFSAEEFNAFR